jgi:hypothetical protein
MPKDERDINIHRLCLRNPVPNWCKVCNPTNGELYYKYDIFQIRCQAPQGRSAKSFIVRSTADCIISTISRTFFAVTSAMTGSGGSDILDDWRTNKRLRYQSLVRADATMLTKWASFAMILVRSWIQKTEIADGS